MDLIFDFNFGIAYSDSYFGPFYALWLIISHGGWVILLFTVLLGLWWTWITWRKNLYDASIEFVFLAIDVPKDNEQTPKAVENIFAHLHGIQKKGNMIARLIHGYNQQGFSLEIISIGGYIQFLIRTPVKFRDLVEAAIYAQYPNAEITEVEDYVERYKVEFPNDDFDIWGAELKLDKKEVYPIKTYIAFEDPKSEEFYKDPMASLLEILSRLKESEELWIQFVIAPPNGDEWREKGIKIIKKLIGAKSTSKGANFSWLPTNVIKGVTESLTASIIPPSDLGSTADNKDEGFRWPTMMQHLTPHEKAVVEAIGIKISKIAFQTKIRILYLAKKEVFKQDRIIPAVLGAMKQYNTLDMNALKRDRKTKTSVVYPPIKSIVEWRENNRKRRIMWGFKYRSARRGRNVFMFNTEELASLYHFPVSTVKAPLVKKTEARKGEPPVSLPLETPFQKPVTREHPIKSARPPAQLPDENVPKLPKNLPYA